MNICSSRSRLRCRARPQLLQCGNQIVDGLAMLSALVSTMSCHGDAGSSPAAWCRAGPGLRARVLRAGVTADDVHQRADGELRKMTEVREQPVVLFGVDQLRTARSSLTNSLSVVSGVGSDGPV